MNTHVEYEDLAVYATGTAEAGEAERIRQHVDSCVPCRNELQRLYGDLGLLAMAAPDDAPSSSLKHRLMDSIARDEMPARLFAAPERRFRWQWAATTAVLLLTLSTGLLWVRNASLTAKLGDTGNQLVELQSKSDAALKVAATLNAPDALRLTLVKAGEKPQPQLQTIYSVAQRRVLLTASGLGPLPTGKAYELWVLPTSGNPVAAGVFHADAAGHVDHNYEFKTAVEAKGFAITVEDDSGSDAPTTKPIYVGLKN